MNKAKVLVTFLLLMSARVAFSAAPPPLLNYQGVLRDASDRPLDGPYPMEFRFFNAPVGGALLLTDSHATVTVQGGLFNVTLGTGAAPALEPSLSDVFRNHTEIYLEVQVGSETLLPRVRVVSAGYSLNADHLDGRDASYFLDTSTSTQIKAGSLACDNGYFTRVGVGTTSPQQDLSVYNGMGIDQADANSGDLTNALTFGSSSGEGIASKRTAGGNRHGLDLFTSSTPRVSITTNGKVGIGTPAPTDALHIVGTTRVEVPTQSPGIHITAGGRGIEAVSQFGVSEGGNFEGQGSDAWGIYAKGTSRGGLFVSGDPDIRSVAHIAWGGTGGSFWSYTSGIYVDVASDIYKISGNGTMSFIQNHPVDKDKIIVYSAPEGDEVAVFTRGSAQLVGGEARVQLGSTFHWVTNPDVGLTVYLTPVGRWSDIYVVSKGTDEIVVRSAGGDPDAAFDYIVYGLRIGFEESSILQEKKANEESFIPSMVAHRRLYERHPEFRPFNALERFKAMRTATGMAAQPDLTRAAALRGAIHEFDPAVDKQLEPRHVEAASRGTGGAAASSNERANTDAFAPAALPAMIGTLEGPSANTSPIGVLASPFVVSEGIEPGDVVAADPLQPGLFKRSDEAKDPTIVGVAVAKDPNHPDQVLVAVAGVVDCSVDAAFGSIRVGDLLTASPTAGYAMRTTDLDPGTILGKALDPLESGTGIIKILVLLR